MKQITQLLDHLLARVEQDWQLKLRAEWSTIMGDLSSRARLERIIDTTVVIGVYDSHWMHELHALSRMILARINGALAGAYPEGFAIKQVRCIWVAKRPSRINKKITAPQNPVPLRDSAFLPPLVVSAVESMAVAQNSHGLKEALLAYYQRCSQMRGR